MSTFWKIEERVGCDYYIVLDGIYETRESAQRTINAIPGHNRMRVVRYRRGLYQGAIRDETYHMDAHHLEHAQP